MTINTESGEISDSELVELAHELASDIVFNIYVTHFQHKDEDNNMDLAHMLTERLESAIKFIVEEFNKLPDFPTDEQLDNTEEVTDFDKMTTDELETYIATQTALYHSLDVEPKDVVALAKIDHNIIAADSALAELRQHIHRWSIEEIGIWFGKDGIEEANRQQIWDADGHTGPIPDDFMR